MDWRIPGATVGHFRYISDLMKAGKYLYLPPGFEGEVPEDYTVLRPRTYRVWVFLRASIADGVDKAAEFVKGSHPENWLTWNGKFPGGWQHAVQTIRDAGMIPGIWVHRVHRANDRHIADLLAAKVDPRRRVQQLSHSHIGRALVAYYQATGERRILDALVKVHRDYPLPDMPTKVFAPVSGAVNLDPMLDTYAMSGDAAVLENALEYARRDSFGELTGNWANGQAAGRPRRDLLRKCQSAGIALSLDRRQADA